MSPTEKKVQSWPPPACEVWPEPERRLVAQLRPDNLPRHIAVIMDGNGRWARRQGFLDRIRGHEAGIESVREITRTCAALGIKVLTLYAFSKENWRRPRHEIAALMALLKKFAVNERAELMDNDIQFRVIGNLGDLPPRVREDVDQTIRLTRGNTGTTLVLALSYGGRDEILRAAREVARRAAAGRLDPETLDEEAFGQYLDTAGFDDPDLMIRTSGENRISNFLLWQIAYAELHVTDVLWPDFRRRHLLEALVDFKNRDRRFGRVGDRDRGRKATGT